MKNKGIITSERKEQMKTFNDHGNAVKMFERYCSDDYDLTEDFTYTELETEIKRAVRKQDKKIDLNLLYEMIELASEVEYDRNEDEHLNKSWEKAINNYLKKFYPKEKYYYLFPYEQETRENMTKYKVTAGQTQYTTYEIEVEANSPEEAEKIALATDMNKWDDERTENGDSLSVDEVEEIKE